MNIEAGAPAGAGRAAVGQDRVGIGHVHHVLPRRRRARILYRSHHARAPEQRALGRGVHDHVGDQPGKIDVIGADRKQDQIELAVGLSLLRSRDGLAQFGQLRVDRALASAT